MSISSKKSNEEFDRAVCFTCFASWVEALRSLADSNAQAAIDAFLILSDYCLYGIHPAPESNPWGFVWPVVERQARQSISNRRRGFGSEDVEMSNAIRAYHAEHPEASQRAIAEAVGCSQSKVSNVLRDLNRSPLSALSPIDDDSDDYGNGSGNHNSLSLHPVIKTDDAVFGSPLSALDGTEVTE